MLVTKKFKVIGSVTISVEKTVEVSYDDKDEDFVDEDGTVDEDALKSAAIDMAYSEFGGIHEFVGNGGVDKLIGVYGTDESIHADGEVDFDKAEEAE